jgi:peroxiredoxin
MKKLISLVILSCMFFSCYAVERSEIAPDAEQITPLLNGQFVPDVILQTSFGKDISLKMLVEAKPSVILFYRGGWCPYCNRQMAGLIEYQQRIIELGYQIIAISADSPQRLQQQKTSDEFEVILLSDQHLTAIKAFGLGYFLDESTANLYRDKLGAKLTTLEGSEKVVLPVPAAYIVDSTGLVQFQYDIPIPLNKCPLSEKLLGLNQGA